MKKVAFVMLSAVIALLAAILIVPSFFDWNTQKERIETAASETLSQRVRITGDIGLKLLPTPRLKAEGLEIGARDALETGPYVSAGLIDIRVAFLPLLSGKVEAGQVVLRDAEIALLTGQDPSAAAPKTESEGAASPDISLPNIKIENAAITLIDASSGEEKSVSKIDLDVSAKTIYGPFSAEGNVRYQGTPIAISLQTANIQAEDFPFEINILASDAADLNLSFTGSAADILADTARAEGQLRISTADLGRALKAFTGAENEGLAGESLSLSAPVAFEAGRLTIEDIALQFAGADVSGTAAVDTTSSPLEINAAFSAKTIDVSPFLTPPQADAPLLEEIAVSLPENIAAQIQFNAARVIGLTTDMERVSFEARLNNGRLDITRASALLPGGVSAEGRGAFQSPNGILLGAFNAQVKGANSESLLRSLMGANAALPPAPTPINLNIDAQLEEAGLRAGAIVGTLGATQLNGSGKISYGAKPVIDIRANVNTLTLSDWTAPSGSAPSPSTASTPFDGEVRFDLALSRLRAGDQLFDTVAFAGSLKNDVLAIQTAQLGDGAAPMLTVSGQVTGATSTAPKLDLKFSAKATSINQLLALTGTAPIEPADKAGALDAKGTIKGRQESPQIAASGTLGDLAFQTNAALGALDSEAPSAVGTASFDHPNLAGLLARLDFIEQTAVGQYSSDATLSTSFDTRGGKTNASADLKSAAGTAQMRFVQEDADYDVTASANAPSLTQYLRGFGFAFDPAGARLGGLNLALKLGGPMSALTLSTLKADIGPAKLSGTGRLDLSGDVALIDLRLTGQNLDLAELMPEPDTGAQAAAEGTGERWSKEPLDFAMLERVDGAVTLDLDRLTLRDYELKNARLSLASQGKTMRVALDRGTLFNGPANLTLALDAAQTPTLTIDLGFKEGDIAAATRSSAAIEPLTGTFELSGAFKGAGASEYDIVKSLSGSANFAARDGVINGVNIVTLNERFGSLSTVNDFLRIIGSALKGGQTAYRLIAVDIAAKDGILTTQNMRTDIDGGAKATLDSRINLPDWSIAATGAFTLEDHPAAPPVGVLINGPLDNAQITYQTKKLQEYIGVRLGAAVLKGVVTGEGFGLKDLLGGGQTQTEAPGDGTSDEPAQAVTQEPEEEATSPEEEIRDLILRGLFGKKKT